MLRATNRPQFWARLRTNPTGRQCIPRRLLLPSFKGRGSRVSQIAERKRATHLESNILQYIYRRSCVNIWVKPNSGELTFPPGQPTQFQSFERNEARLSCEAMSNPLFGFPACEGHSSQPLLHTIPFKRPRLEGSCRVAVPSPTKEQVVRRPPIHPSEDSKRPQPRLESRLP